MSSALEVRDICKVFRARRPLLETLRHPFRRSLITALDRVSFDVAPGECFGLLGENGAGKTTLFKILSTLVMPEEGRASVFGVDLGQHPARTRELLAPVLASERSLYWRLSALENLRAFAGLQHLAAPVAAERSAGLLTVVGLDTVGSRMVGTFSSGMRQRLLLARALLAEPRLLLLDEPTRSLDPIAARKFREFLRSEIVGRLGCTIVVATHSAEEVRELCDRVGVLHRGRMLATGTSAALESQLGNRRFRLVTTEPNHSAIEALAGRGVILGRIGDDEIPWRYRELDLAPGGQPPQDILSNLVAAGVAVARFEAVEVPLPDLIQRLASGSAEARP